MNNNPRFCTRCGGKLEHVLVGDVFDKDTGESVNVVELRCPNWQKPRMFRRHEAHDAYWLNRHGDACPIWVR